MALGASRVSCLAQPARRSFFHTTAQGWGGLSKEIVLMIAQASVLNDWHSPCDGMEELSTSALFESMLPKLRELATFAFRRCRPQQRNELIAAVVAKAYVALLRLVE